MPRREADRATASATPRDVRSSCPRLASRSSSCGGETKKIQFPSSAETPAAFQPILKMVRTADGGPMCGAQTKVADQQRNCTCTGVVSAQTWNSMMKVW
jgi:hypothetical protein